MAILNGDEPVSPLSTPVIHITSHNAAGQAIVKSSNKDPVGQYPGMRTSHKLVYTTSKFPMDLTDEKDLKEYQNVVSSGNLSIVQKNGTVCRIVDFGPHNKSMMHRTQSLDFGVVLEGQIIMELDDGSKTLMNRGDVAVQRATMHTWKNASETEWARMLFVLQDCQPLLIDGQRFKEDLGIGHSVFPKSGNDVDVKA
jgi:quercetin dioxygenase-like cupin family protein